MKNRLMIAALAAVAGAVATSASAQSTYGDVARVISATPIYDRVSSPRRECRTEQVTAYEERREVRPAPESAAPPPSGGIGPGTVLGAIVGGVIGHQFGNSTGGRDHGTAAGAVIGGLVGNSIDRDAEAGYRQAGREVVVDRVPVTRDVQRCADVADTRDVVVGFDVRYEYNGREFRARLPDDPGPHMPVNVEVRPPAERTAYDGPRTPRYRGSY